MKKMTFFCLQRGLTLRLRDYFKRTSKEEDLLSFSDFLSEVLSFLLSTLRQGNVRLVDVHGPCTLMHRRYASDHLFTTEESKIRILFHPLMPLVRFKSFGSAVEHRVNTRHKIDWPWCSKQLCHVTASCNSLLSCDVP